MVNKEIEEIKYIKIGIADIPIKIDTNFTELFCLLIADHVNQKLKFLEKQYPATFHNYAMTAFEFAKEKISLEKKVNDKINNLESIVKNLLDEVDTVLQDKE